MEESGVVKQGMAAEVLAFLKQECDKGQRWVVYDTDEIIAGSWDLRCFESQIEALDFAGENQQIFNWHLAVPIENLIYTLEKTEYSLKDKIMNRNSLEDFRDNAKALKIPKEMVGKVEEQMEKNVLSIEVTGKIPSRR